MTGLSAEPPREPARRARLVEEAAAHGVPALHARLSTLDPQAAARLHPTDRQRVIRALEVVESSGRPTSWWHAQAARPALEADWCTVELTVAPPVLARRIDARTRAMFEGGLLDETRDLRTAGREHALRALRAVGYDEAIELLAGRIDREEAEARTSQRTRQLAKRQRTWFRHQLVAERIGAESETVEAISARVLAAFTRRGGNG
jgi:tRNA dimethylallyltransferase